MLHRYSPTLKISYEPIVLGKYGAWFTSAALAFLLNLVQPSDRTVPFPNSTGRSQSRVQS